MAEDKTKPSTTETHDETTPDQSARQPQQSQTSETAGSDQATSRVRKPLFRR